MKYLMEVLRDCYVLLHSVRARNLSKLSTF